MPAISDSFSAAYSGGELDAFFDCPRPPGVLESAAASDRPRSALARAMAAHAMRLGAHPAVAERARRLALPGSAAVVTGQQAGLLLGPNFTLSKSASASSLAGRLDSEDSPVVPVFWLASQDHDVAEIDHTHVLDLDEKLLKVALQLPGGVPASDIPWQGEWLGSLLAQLDGGRWQPEFQEETGLILRRAAEAAHNWSDFFAALYYAVLGADAPLLLDPSVPELAVLFQDVLAREIMNPQASVDAINLAADRLRRLGHAPQLGRGRDATNLFITVSGPQGLPQRQLLRHSDGRFHSGGHNFSRDDLLSILTAEPGRITPAAGLRPVCQDAVLPSAAFVVGPGELRYLAQLRDVYRLHRVDQPTIWPRSQVTLLEPPVSRILSNLGLDAAGYSSAPDSHEQRTLLGLSGASVHFEQAVAALEQSQLELHKALLGLDPTLKGAVERHAGRVESSLELLRAKAARSALRRDEVLNRQFKRLRSHLLPAGTRQERLVSPFSFMLKFGLAHVRRLFAGVPESGDSWLGV